MGEISVTETLSQVLGSVIKDFDVSADLSATECELLREMIACHHLILIRDVNPSPTDQRRLLQVFGTVVDEKENGLYYSLVRNRISPDSEEGDECIYHCDYSFRQTPVAVVSLFGMEVPAECARTRFANGVRALRELPAQLRERLEGKMVLHASDVTSATAESSGRLQAEDLYGKEYASALHPAILTHPKTGERILFINQYLCVRIEGLSQTESEALLSEVFARTYTEDNVYEHRWRQGDLLMFDNIALQHMRLKGAPRILRRMIAY